jgi:hypothetical protein
MDIFKMSILPFARGSFKNTKRKYPKMYIMTEMLSKRVFIEILCD